MSDLPAENDSSKRRCCGCGSKLGLVNLVLNAVILLILLIHFLGHHHHWRCSGHHHDGMGMGYGQPGFHGPFPGGPGPGGPGPMERGHEWGAWGHGPQDPKAMQDQALDHLTRFLSLTDEQKNQLRPIVNDTVAALEKNREQSHAAAKQIMDAAKAKALPFLNADQKKIIDSLPEHKP